MLSASDAGGFVTGSSTGADGRRFCTVWGMDPVFASEPLPAGPYTHQFPLRTAVGTSISLLEEPGEEVTVVGHTPDFDNDRTLWFCDVQLDAGNAYTPLVQFHLARYQPHSIPRTHLSKTVKTDFIQVLPRREATFVVSPDSTAMAVTLRGAVGVPRHAIGLPNVPSEVKVSRVVEAWAERMGIPGHAPATSCALARRDLSYNQMVVREMLDDEMDRIFHALADATRRDIVVRVLQREQSVSALAEGYAMSFAAVQKHVAVLERASLIVKERRGREQIVHGNLDAVRKATQLLEKYEELWRYRAQSISDILSEGEEGESPRTRNREQEGENP